MNLYQLKKISNMIQIVLIALAFFVVPTMVLASDSATDEASGSQDCGAKALYLLLHLQGFDVSYAEVEGVLPNQVPQGYSMLELVEAAAVFGLDLKGYDFRSSDLPRDRAIIVYGESGGNGHFVVLKPVGSTGKMVQLLNPPYPPQIVDIATLRNDPAWTDLFLVPRFPLERHASILLKAICAVILMILGMLILKLCLKNQAPSTNME